MMPWVTGLAGRVYKKDKIDPYKIHTFRYFKRLERKPLF
jgi:hypothetical protein